MLEVIRPKQYLSSAHMTGRASTGACAQTVHARCFQHDQRY